MIVGDESRSQQQLIALIRSVGKHAVRMSMMGSQLGPFLLLLVKPNDFKVDIQDFKHHIHCEFL